MLREILYRGQTRRFGEKIKNFAGDPMPSNWVFGGVCTPPNVQGCFAIIYGSGDAYRDRETGITYEKHVVYRDTVGQYVGKRDKNSRLIFEDDIVSAPNGYTGVVEMVRFLAALYHGEVSDEIEVIGNIHDNPELLQKKTINNTNKKTEDKSEK